MTFHTNGAGTLAGKMSIMSMWLRKTAHCAAVAANASASESTPHGRHRSHNRTKPVRVAAGGGGGGRGAHHNQEDATWLAIKYPVDVPDGKPHAAEFKKFNAAFSVSR